jgi:hypothetical protein
MYHIRGFEYGTFAQRSDAKGAVNQWIFDRWERD